MQLSRRNPRNIQCKINTVDPHGKVLDDAAHNLANTAEAKSRDSDENQLCDRCAAISKVKKLNGQFEFSLAQVDIVLVTTLRRAIFRDSGDVWIYVVRDELELID